MKKLIALVSLFGILGFAAAGTPRPASAKGARSEAQPSEGVDGQLCCRSGKQD